MTRTDLIKHKVVSLNEWLEARKQFLIQEKEFTRLRDQLSRQRRNLPWVKVEKNYVFDGPGGKTTLAELFEGRGEWREVKPHLGVILRTVSVRRGAHFAARFCQELIVFRATFSSTRFAAVGAQWD